jgi:hypothetical protein
MKSNNNKHKNKTKLQSTKKYSAMNYEQMKSATERNIILLKKKLQTFSARSVTSTNKI